jgi:hypothetical protein
MHRNRPTAIAPILTLCVVLGACAPAAPPEISGNLYFGSGNYLATLALRNGNTDIVASIGNAEIQEISAKDGRRILLNVFGPVNQKDSHRLVLFDLESRQQLTFFEGRFGRYLMDGQTLVYDDGARIWATWKRVNYWEKVEVAQHPFNAMVRIVPVSDTAFLYSIGSDNTAPVYLFDTTQRQSTELEMLASVCRLDGAVWIEARSVLLCRTAAVAHGENAYVFAGLDGTVNGSLQLPPDKSFRALAYLPDRNSVVLSESWRTWMSGRQKWAVWIYDIGEAASYRILEHQYLGHTVIYQAE